MNRRDFIKSAFLAVALAPVTGCNVKSKEAGASPLATTKAADAPIYVAFLVDGTYSSAENRKKGLEHLSFLLKPGAMPKGSKLNIIRMDCAPKSIWSGKINGSFDKKEILSAFDEALDGSRQCGTDGCKAYTKALDWLISESQNTPSARLIVTGYHDCIADECTTGKGTAHPVSEVKFTWPRAKAAEVEVFMFGVNENLLPKLREAWSPRLTSVTLYAPSHRITKEDLGFTAGSIF